MSDLLKRMGQFVSTTHKVAFAKEDPEQESLEIEEPEEVSSEVEDEPQKEDPSLLEATDFAEATHLVEVGEATIKDFKVTKTVAFEFSDTSHGKMVNFQGHGVLTIKSKDKTFDLPEVLFVYRKTDTAVSDPSMVGGPRSDTDRVLLRKDQDLSEPYGEVSSAMVNILKGLVSRVESQMKQVLGKAKK